MRLARIVTLFLATIGITGTAFAEEQPNAVKPAPKLVVAIAIDQFSSDLFHEYRDYFTGGLQRLASGAVYSAGYQAHAATETCPGHATIMTGVHAGRAGIIANNWIDLSIERDDKTVYCAEDERIAGTSFGSIIEPSRANYVPSAWHLLVPTLGERLKAVSPASRNVAVAGKDRAALMMAGTNADAIYWWKGKGFATLNGEDIAPAIGTLNAYIGAQIDKASPPAQTPEHCAARNREIIVSDKQSVGTYAFQRPQNGSQIFRATPDFDGATINAALALVKSMKLGQGGATDVLSIGLSATDYIGHAFGTGGLEMCIQMTELDRNLGELFSELDARNIDYVAMLTSDHGGHDLPERLRSQGVPQAERIDPDLNAKDIGDKIRQMLSVPGEDRLLHADSPFGDYYVSLGLDPETRQQVKMAAIEMLRDHPQVHAVLDHDQLAAMSTPAGPVEEWSMAERAKASFHPDRSGDFIVLLKKAITPIARPGLGYVATHGSPWDYDRQVPILFWHQDIAGFEQPLSVSTVDIAPTLASLIGLALPVKEMDGRCLDIDGGPESNCKGDR